MLDFLREYKHNGEKLLIRCGTEGVQMAWAGLAMQAGIVQLGLVAGGLQYCGRSHAQPLK